MDFVTTADGSKTLFNAEIGEHYHSKHGALQESKHVFLETGLVHLLSTHDIATVSILEVGFGTGLNFLVTADYLLGKNIHLDYCGIEAYPLGVDTILNTGYDAYVDASLWSKFGLQYENALQQEIAFTDSITLHIAHEKVLSYGRTALFDLIYFDAFAAIHQPEMWNDETLAHVCKLLKPGGVFVTYAITGNLKRSIKALGFKIEKTPGAPGKREMLRATKH